MRPRYETKDDLDREQHVAAILEQEWRCRLEKLPIRYHLDYVITQDGKAVAFCEIKTRRYSMEQIDKMGGYLMSIGKWTSAMALSDSSGLPFILTAVTTCGVWYAVFRSGEFDADDVLVRGRTDRNDWQDVEPCVLLYSSRFTRIN
ncbi:MAG: hypothetical protein ACK5SP_02180 [bacterium]